MYCSIGLYNIHFIQFYRLQGRTHDYFFGGRDVGLPKSGLFLEKRGRLRRFFVKRGPNPPKMALFLLFEHFITEKWTFFGP